MLKSLRSAMSSSSKKEKQAKKNSLAVEEFINGGSSSSSSHPDSHENSHVSGTTFNVPSNGKDKDKSSKIKRKGSPPPVQPSNGVEQNSTSATSPATSASNGQSQSIAQSSNRTPDIPTTTTILSNPLPQVLDDTSGKGGKWLGRTETKDSTGNGPSASSGKKGEDTGPQSFDIDSLITRLLNTSLTTLSNSTSLSSSSSLLKSSTKSPPLKNSEILAICSASREVLLSQPTLLELSPPVKIVGDVHGQYADLVRLFEMCGWPPESNYLFLGDYVDRGKMSLETILLLLCYKIKYPENFFLLRGNHECANVTRVYGFYDECKRRCNLKIWKAFIDVFNTLPICAIVASKIFCVHGGLSPSLSSMDDIRRIARPTDVPDYGLLNDLLWSDPSDTAYDWEDNERGVSYCFGKVVIGEFLQRYDFDLICRAHMVVEDGYEFWNERTLVTVFSAPNYCGEFDNFGAVMSVSEDLLCAFELLKPLDGAALKKEMAKSKKRITGVA